MNIKLVTCWLLFLCFLCGNKVYSQSYADPDFYALHQEVKAADFIVEAELIDQKQSFDPVKKNVWYEINIFKIKKIFKGALQCGTIEVLCERSMSYTFDGPNPISFRMQEKGEQTALLFLKKDLGDIYNPNIPVISTNSYRTRTDFGFTYSMDKYDIRVTAYSMNGYMKQFNNYQVFRAYFDKTTGLAKPQVCEAFYFDNPPSPLPRPKPTPKTNDIESDSVPEQQKKWKEHLEKQQNRQKLNYKGKANTVYDLYYSYGNISVSGTDNKYVEFDVFINSNSAGTFLYDAYFFLDYNNSLFGNDVAGNSKITVTPGSALQALDYVPIVNDFVGTDDRVSIDISVSGSTTTMIAVPEATVPPTPLLLCHVVFEQPGTATCHASTDIYFTDPNGWSGGTYSLTAPKLLQATYSATHRPTDPIAFLTCEPFIKSIASSNAIATNYYGGIGDVLTITGFNFGSTKGSGDVRFRTANNITGDFGFYTIDAGDYVSGQWSDTEIKVKIPDHVAQNDASGVDAVPCCSVQVRDNGSYPSEIDINIKYSCYNGDLSGGGKTPIYPANMNDAGGYTFVLDPAFNNKNALRCITAALKAWSCSTGVNWVIKGFETIATPNANDGKCYIYSGSIAGLGLTKRHVSSCTASDYANTEFDIGLTNSGSYTWDYKLPGETIASGGNVLDFYSILLHELGHGLGLKHSANGNTDVMRFVMSSNSNRFVIGADAAALGGKHLTNFSANSASFHASCATHGRMKLAYHDLYMADFVTVTPPSSVLIYDPGNEPDYESNPTLSTHYNIWNSPYLWNRINADGGLGHQNPEYTPSTPNYLYYTIKNLGCSATVANEESLHLYWTISAYGEKWPSDWDGSNYIGLNKKGDEITNPITGILLPSIAAGAVTSPAYIAWNPPRPQDYLSTWNQLDVCVLGRIQNHENAEYGMMFKENTGVHVGTNVFNNNNIATKNLIVFNLDGNYKSGSGRRPSLLSNTTAASDHFDLGLSNFTDPITAHDFFDVGYATVYLGPDLWDRWETNGSNGDDITPDELTYTIRLNSVSATIEDIDLDVDESAFIEVGFSLYDSLSTFDPDTFYLTLSQYRVGAPSSEIEGAIVYEIDVDSAGAILGRMRSKKTEDEEDVALNIFPNAVTDMLFIKADKPIEEQPLFEVYDVLGRKVMEDKFNGKVFVSHRINMERLAQGAYFIKVTYSSAKPKIYKFIKR